MRVLSLDAGLGGGFDEFTFKGDISVFDYDLVLWNPERSLARYGGYRSEYRGRDALDDSSSAALRRDVERRRAEFREFVDAGRVFAVIVPGDSTVFADTGQRTYSGTGRNRQTTRIVSEVEILAAAPVDLQRSLGSGIELAAASEVGTSLLRAIGESAAYKCTIDRMDPSLSPLLHVKGTEKVVSGWWKSQGGGYIVLLPMIYFDETPESEDDYLNEEDESSETGAVSPVAVALVEWLRNFTERSVEAAPPWAESLLSAPEIAREVLMASKEQEVATIREELDAVKAAQAGDARWRTLLYGSGKTLERQVGEALRLLGFSVDDEIVGRSDVRAHLDDTTYVIEVKGVAKSGAEKHAAQLEKWIADEVAVGDSAARGILVVNGWRDLPPSDRVEATFPDQMLGYCRKREHCLVTGVQLFAMVRTCIDNPARASEIAAVLARTVGVVDGWDDLSGVIVSQQLNDTLEVNDDSAGGCVVELEGPDGS